MVPFGPDPNYSFLLFILYTLELEEISWNLNPFISCADKSVNNKTGFAWVKSDPATHTEKGQWELMSGMDVTLSRPFQMPAFTPAALWLSTVTVKTTLDRMCSRRQDTEPTTFTTYDLIGVNSLETWPKSAQHQTKAYSGSSLLNCALLVHNWKITSALVLWVITQHLKQMSHDFKFNEEEKNPTRQAEPVKERSNKTHGYFKNRLEKYQNKNQNNFMKADLRCIRWK